MRSPHRALEVQAGGGPARHLGEKDVMNRMNRVLVVGAMVAYPISSNRYMLYAPGPSGPSTPTLTLDCAGRLTLEWEDSLKKKVFSVSSIWKGEALLLLKT